MFFPYPACHTAYAKFKDDPLYDFGKEEGKNKRRETEDFVYGNLERNIEDELYSDMKEESIYDFANAKEDARRRHTREGRTGLFEGIYDIGGDKDEALYDFARHKGGGGEEGEEGIYDMGKAGGDEEGIYDIGNEEGRSGGGAVKRRPVSPRPSARAKPKAKDEALYDFGGAIGEEDET